MITVDLSKQQALDSDPKVIQQINFTGNLVKQEEKDSILFLKKEKKLFSTVFFTRNCKSFVNANILKMFDFYQYKNDTIQQFKCKAIKSTV